MLKLLINNFLFKLLLALISTAFSVGVFYVLFLKLAVPSPPRAVEGSKTLSSPMAPSSVAPRDEEVRASTVLVTISAEVSNDETTAEVHYQAEPCTPSGGLPGRVYKAQGPVAELSLQLSESFCLEVREGALQPIENSSLSWGTLDPSDELPIYTESRGVSFVDKRGEPKVLLVGAVGACDEVDSGTLCSGFVSARVGGPLTSLAGSLVTGNRSVAVSSSRSP